MTAKPRFDRLETERLIMRRWQDSDREPFAELNADPHTMRFFPSTLDRAGSDALIEIIESRFESQGYGLWALEVAATGEFIGFTGLNPMPDDVPGAGGVEVGWRLAKRGWHQGYATEAASAALGVAFGAVGLPEIWSMTAVLNEPSIAVMRRIGLTEVDRFDHPRITPSARTSPTTRTTRDSRQGERVGKPACCRLLTPSSAPMRCAIARTGRRMKPGSGQDRRRSGGQR